MSDTHSAGRPAQRWTGRDTVIVGGLAGLAAVAIGLGFVGLSRVQPVAGLALILTLAYCLSSARHAIDYRTVGWGLALQFLFAVVVLKTGVGQAVFRTLGAYITKLLDFAYVGSPFVFGPLGNREVWPRITLNQRELLSAPAGKVMTYFMTPIAISSTAIRNLAAAGQSIRYLTPDPVVEYVRSHRLYDKP